MWSIGTGGTLTANTGPSNDHTLGTNRGMDSHESETFCVAISK